jgi:excisionase family DNA binding protein
VTDAQVHVEPALLSVAEAAERLGMAERTLRNWMAQEDFPLHRLRRGCRWALSARQVQRYLDGEIEIPA